MSVFDTDPHEADLEQLRTALETHDYWWVMADDMRAYRRGQLEVEWIQAARQNSTMHDLLVRAFTEEHEG